MEETTAFYCTLMSRYVNIALILLVSFLCIYSFFNNHYIHIVKLKTSPQNIFFYAMICVNADQYFATRRQCCQSIYSHTILWLYFLSVQSSQYPEDFRVINIRNSISPINYERLNSWKLKMMCNKDSTVTK